jgi:DNA-binding NtrC family response regulator
VQRVGSPAATKVDVRVVAATNRDLQEMARQGKFREDLYFRLSAIELKVPALAERPEDLPLLERHFLKAFAAQYNRSISGLTRRAQTVLARYPWPGNIRELQNVIEHACMMTESDVIDVRDLPDRVQNQSGISNADSEVLMSIDQLERRHAQRVLDHVGGNKVRAAEILGISRTHLYQLLKDAAEKAEKQKEPVSKLDE